MNASRIAPLDVPDDFACLAPRLTVTRLRIAYAVVPLLIALAAVLWLEIDGGNRLIADRLYAWQGGHWLLKDNVITSTVIHHGGKYLSLALWLAAFAAWWQTRGSASFAGCRRSLQYLLLATVLSTLLVSALQSLTSIGCPWDMQTYGGPDPFSGLFDARPFSMRNSGCFPAGHASAGYCWIALYFFFGDVAPGWRRRGLAFGLGLGLVFGISQQLRGAHFASHDVATLLVCWLSAWILHAVMRPARGTSA